MSDRHLSWAMAQNTGSPAVKLILVALCDLADDDGIVPFSIERLVEITELRTSQVVAAVETLRKRDLLETDGEIWRVAADLNQENLQ
jgi:hypothetical protein